MTSRASLLDIYGTAERALVMNCLSLLRLVVAEVISGKPSEEGRPFVLHNATRDLVEAIRLMVNPDDGAPLKSLYARADALNHAIRVAEEAGYDVGIQVRELSTPRGAQRGLEVTAWKMHTVDPVERSE